MKPNVVLGIDVGTQGVRILAVDTEGRLVASAHRPLPAGPSGLPPGWFEQDPLDWWEAVQVSLRSLLADLPQGTHISGLCVDSTSGTVLPVDAAGRTVHPALMYNDRRSEPHVAAVQSAGAELQSRLGYMFGSSFALPKLLWFKDQLPGVFARTHRFLHAADFIAGRITGCYDFSDTSNALKTGYDLIGLRWPGFIETDLGIPLRLLPQVVLPGEPLGQVSRQAADETGLAVGTPVYAGATDGTAAQIASGAAQPGEWNSTLGTTLVLKGIARDLVLDPLGRIYSHRYPRSGDTHPQSGGPHPQSGRDARPWWMPGGASNTGAGWIAHDHPNDDPRELDRRAATLAPTRLVRYPLAKRGERFPFVHAAAEGFTLGDPASTDEYYAAGLEGVALLERLAYDALQALGLEVGEKIYITGGGSRSRLWSLIRASTLKRPLVRPAVTETAMGAAILAASGCWYASLSEAAGNMVRIAETIEPNPARQGTYDENYARFLDELKCRGYLEYL